MKILIKGAGDLATGIASRLYGAGHQIMMTEIPVPLTVRRTVALSRAVYAGWTEVEEMKAFRADSREEAGVILSRGDIPVIVDPEAECRSWYEPDVVVDAILAKKNLGTRITDAPFVIGVGPGFTAGNDCHCVVETKRGHTLGNIIWRGSAIPNTGVPGNVGGYTIERLIRASADGQVEPRVKIGDCVEAGQVVAVTGGKPVYAQMGGIVRGMLQEGVYVPENLKIGDIDARAEVSHCHTISDKARAIGGGVLEAVNRFEIMKGRYAIVILAAGAGTRFGGDKLRALVREKPLYEHMLDKVKAFSSFPAFIVTGDSKIAEDAAERGVVPVWNEEPEKGIARSLRLGLAAARKAFADEGREDDLRGILFSVCDQPGLEITTMQKIFNTAVLHPVSIICAGRAGRTGNPVLWDRRYFAELEKLTGDVGGRRVMNEHKDRIRIVETEAEELIDVDRREDLESL
ncbi:MAG TPA: EF2563 family selenium-dependent molybdenum hydroxylase system protein [Candidatus Mediterraneibacter stercorigallinarum]|uniref:EF2563 family selenium-dependent molybdenum hydroxylase system protein n=1 Tax=Candidatus Mediterraneibacter stercorigallinarum TaxID=2838686 RepID=A0A9D2DB16_9FIRM|nr:EF2563 family selenium-dependent molybdenum hydroxylase system protein [Candidatus Mediterraneibacter stercorigallinarum]